MKKLKSKKLNKIKFIDVLGHYFVVSFIPVFICNVIGQNHPRYLLLGFIISPALLTLTYYYNLTHNFD